MSYYGVSVIITILLTSLIAFYLLYKAKELNLGIVISISIGSVVLGFTFSPAFKAVLNLLSNNINQKIALVLSLLSVLFVFLLFILIISFIVSICIPKKLAAIDCCVIIDRVLSKISIKSIKGKIVEILGKNAAKMREKVKNVYNLKNKLKKPVDTKQIIDTMGIEKSNMAFSYEESSDAIDNSDTFTFSNLLGFMETSSEVTYENQDESIDMDIVDQGLEAADVYHNLATIAYQEVVTTQSSDFETEATEDDLNNLEEITIKVNVEDQGFENQVIEEEIVEGELADGKLPVSQDRESEIVVNENTESETVASENTESEIIENEITEVVILESNQTMPSIANNTVAVVIDAKSLVLKAFESKDEGRKEEAIEQYIEALRYDPDNEMIFWIVLDVCTLYKQLGLSELAKNILEGLVNEYESVIQPEIKMEIMNNLK